ncbi:MAG: type IX secretion system membrane protein PorP/SprF [Bacteroidales bacterium]|nr:type IX secretion system membrane protein PorP/SprF [Bacteroidales bacterium]
MKTLFKILILMMLQVSVIAQNTPQFSLRYYDIQIYNPAIVGSTVYDQFMLHHRTQWLGFDGRPTTNIISYSGTIMQNSGIGGYVYFDKAGPTQHYGANLNYAYHIVFPKFNVSLGLSSTISQYRFQTDQLLAPNPNDPVIAGKFVKSSLMPDASAGVYMYNRKFYAGLSINQLIQSRLKQASKLNVEQGQRVYCMGGYNVFINQDIELIPNATIIAISSEPWQFESGVRALISDKFIAGLNYRLNDALIAMAGFKYTNWLFAYSYDITLSLVRKYSSGSHEIILAYQFENRTTRKHKPLYDADLQLGNKRR